MRRRAARAVAACVSGAVAACARMPAPAPVATRPAVHATARPAAPGGTLPIRIRSTKVGSQYIFLTRQNARNRKVYVLRADAERGEYDGANSGRSTFTNPHVTFFKTDGKPVVADAPAGTVVERDKSVLMSGGVRARTQDGTTLSSETLRYEEGTDTLHGAGNVVVVSQSPAGREELRGETLDWNLRDGSIDVLGAH